MSRTRGILYYVRNYRFNSLFLKYFIIVFLCILLPVCMISVTVLTFSLKKAEIEVNKAYINTISVVGDMCDIINNDIHNKLLQLSNNFMIEGFASLEKGLLDSYSFIENCNNVMTTLNYYVLSPVESIYVYSEKNKYLISNLHGVVTLDQFRDNSWYDSYLTHDIKVNAWITTREFADDANNSKRYISYFFRIPNDKKQKDGVIIINVDYERFVGMLGKNDVQKLEDLLILYNDLMFVSPDLSAVGQKADKEIMDMLDYDESMPAIIKQSSSDSYVINFSTYSKFKYVMKIPFSRYNERIMFESKLLYFIMLLVIFVSLIVSYFISIKIFTPIKSILEVIDDTEKNEGKNEFLLIMSSVLQTMDKNKRMEQEIANQMVSLRQAQTVALQVQISPHFLYNTLQSLNWLIIDPEKNNHDATHFVSMLSKMLRDVMHNDKILVTLQEEINYCKSYLEIQKIRYKDMFIVQWDVPEEFYNVRVPKLFIQPLLENCLYHGIKPAGYNGIIAVSVYQKNEGLVISVYDNGVGITKENAIMLTKRINKGENSESIGLYNVCRRIKIIFGEPWGVDIISLEKGTMVNISLPVLKQYYSN